MSILLTQFAETASGPAALGLDGSAFVVQLLTFLVVFLILKKWAFGPILKKLDARRDLIESGIRLGEQMKAEKATLSVQIAQKLQETRAQADKTLAQAQVDARKVIEEAESAATARTDAIVKSAHRQIQITAERERAQLEHELVGLVAQVSEVVVGEKLDGKRDSALIDKALRGREAARE